MQGEDVEEFSAALTNRAHGVDASRTADAAVATWQEMSAAVATWKEMSAILSPIIGTGSVAALYKRSLYLTRQEYPWLKDVFTVDQARAEFGALRQALSQQAASDATAASTTLVQTFRDLLARLIGPSLTVRLLRSTSAGSSQVSPARLRRHDM
jgi:hypothetical protein